MFYILNEYTYGKKYLLRFFTCLLHISAIQIDAFVTTVSTADCSMAEKYIFSNKYRALFSKVFFDEY